MYMDVFLWKNEVVSLNTENCLLSNSNKSISNSKFRLLENSTGLGFLFSTVFPYVIPQPLTLIHIKQKEPKSY